MTYLRSIGAATASNTRFNLLGKAPAGAAALMLGVSALAMSSGTAQAQCVSLPGPFPTAGDDAILCGVAPAGVDALGGNDIILMNPGVGTGTYFGNTGNDFIELDTTGGAPSDYSAATIDGGDGDDDIDVEDDFGFGTSIGTVLGGAGNDDINVAGLGAGGSVTVIGNVEGGADDDLIFLGIGASIGGGVLGDAGNDTINLSGATVTGSLLGGSGDDTINLLSGSTANAAGEAGDDTITLSGADVTGNINSGDGNDVIDLISGTVGADVLGAAGNDTISLNGAVVTMVILSGSGDDLINLVSGSASSAQGDAGNDTINLDGATVNTDILGGTGDDTINVLSGMVNDVFGDEGADTISLNGGTVTGSVLGGAANDTITLDGAMVTSNIEGDGGDDTIDLLSGTVDDVFGGTGEDTITLDGATVTGFIFGDGDDDTIDLISGTVLQVQGNLGADTITLNGATVNSVIRGDEGDDTIILFSGSVFEAQGGDGNDTITLDGANLGSAVSGGLGDDTIELLSGMTVNVFAGAGADTVTLNGATVADDLEGGSGNDIIDLLSGAVADDVQGDSGDDTITLLGAAIGDRILGGAGNDTIALISGSVGDDVFGDDGRDTITLNGATVASEIFGGADSDVITLIAGSVGADVSGGDGNDRIDLLGGIVGDDIDGGAGNDAITLNGTTVINRIFGGTGDDDIDLVSGSFGGNLLDGGTGSDTALIHLTYDLTTIAGVLDGGDDADIADGDIDVLFILPSGTLAAEQLINWEVIALIGSTLTLEGNSLITEDEDSFGVFVNAGSTLDLDDGLAITGDVSIDATSVLVAEDGNGVYSISGDLENFGTIDMSDGIGPNDTLSVGGNYTSFSELLLDVALDATEAGDSLVIAGDILGAPTEITFTDTNPFGPASFTGTGPGNGIVVVDNSAGGFIVDGDFVMDPVAHPTNEILKVPFVYMLNLESDDILYLQSDVLAQIYGYAILAELMREDFPILRERLGDKRYNGFSGDGTDNSGAAGGGVGWDNGGIWARLEGTKRTNEHRGDYTTGEWEASRIEAEVGIDIPMNVGGGQGLFGISTHFIQGFADANSGLTPDPDVAEVDTTGFGAGLSFAYFPGGGFYADVQGRFTAWDADVEVDNRSIDQDINALGWGTSLEVGNRMAFGNTAVTPRGRAVYSDVSFESFTDDDGVKVKQEDSASVVVEGGVTVEQMFPDNGVTIFADASVSHDVLRDSAIDASGFTFDSGLEDTWGTVAIGGSMETGQGTSAFIAAEVSSPFGTSFGNSVGYGLRAGVRVDF